MLDPWLITGFTDGEGCFSLYVRADKQKRKNSIATYYRWEAVFAITLRGDDFPFLKQVQEYFGCGSCLITNKADTSLYHEFGQCHLNIRSIDDLTNKIIPHFDKFPPQSKKLLDFQLWKEAVIIIQGSMAMLTLPTTRKAYSDGGNGGDGGSIYFQASSNISDLSQFRFTKVVKATPGDNGLRKNQHGRKADDEIVLVPPGTKVINEVTGEEIEIVNLDEPILVAKGGRGGRGTHGFKPNTKSTIDYTNEGERGEEKDLHLILSLIADAGLIGFPNAGKSSLLASLTNATPKIGNYPFTTLEPSLGTMGKIVLADIPGLIEGASQGRGLGITFLKHIEKTKILLHCITSEDQDPLNSYKLVHKEFEEFNVQLNEKNEVILLTKTDLVDKPTLRTRIKILKKTGKIIIPVSIYDEESLKQLSEVIRKNTK